MRIGIIALLHESNTFITKPTTLELFESSLLVTGDDVRLHMADTHHEVGGFFAQLDEMQTAGKSLEIVPIFAARAMPYGTITADTMSELMRRLMDALSQAGELDGVLVAPHGATVSEDIRDVDGHWLNEVRQQVGRIPIIGTMDPHANLSPLMVEATDALIAYRSNPHLDQKQRGREAAKLLIRTMEGELRPTQRASFPAMAINIERQLTSEPHCQPLYDLADDQLERDRVLSNSILLGFPYADVEEMGSAALAVTDDDSDLAQQLADELGDYLWNHRQDFDGQLIGIDEAIRQAKAIDGPVCLLDMGDNVGGGSPADSTILPQALLQAEAEGSFACLYDPAVVQAAEATGVGNSFRGEVGAKTDTLHGSPISAEFAVRGIFDGDFVETQPRHGGFTRCDQGRTAVLETGCLTLLVNSRRMPPFSLVQLTSCGLDPARFQILVAKGVNAPVAAYREVCDRMIRVNTPGVTTADMLSLEYRHRRRPLFPFEP